MKYVKLVSRPDMWFKEGTEAYHYDFDWEHRRRYTVEEFQEWKDSGMVCARGIRVCEEGYETLPKEQGGMGCQLGEERIDGECGSLEEFDISIVDEPI